MTKEEEYQNKIQQYSWKELLDLWKAIKADNTPGWGTGKAFEYLVLRAFQLEGAYVVWPYMVTIGELTKTETKETAEQIDGFIHTVDGLACLVECKDYGKDRVNVEPIAKLRNQLLRRPSVVIGIAFSRGGFTDPASLLARFTAPQIILLWGGDEVEIALQNQWFCKGLTAKYRVCVAKGLPDYHISHGV
ncbi:MAG: restriction endonuclease [Chloroflexota bacterium]|nr:restriction endonuclease [Chloroflexota bacterium]